MRKENRIRTEWVGGWVGGGVYRRPPSHLPLEGSTIAGHGGKVRRLSPWSIVVATLPRVGMTGGVDRGLPPLTTSLIHIPYRRLMW